MSETNGNGVAPRGLISWRSVNTSIVGALALLVVVGGVRLWANDQVQDRALSHLEIRLNRELGEIRDELVGLRLEVSDAACAEREDMKVLRKEITQQITEVRHLIVEEMRSHKKGD